MSAEASVFVGSWAHLRRLKDIKYTRSCGRNKLSCAECIHVALGLQDVASLGGRLILPVFIITVLLFCVSLVLPAQIASLMGYSRYVSWQVMVIA